MRARERARRVAASTLTMTYVPTDAMELRFDTRGQRGAGTRANGKAPDYAS